MLSISENITEKLRPINHPTDDLSSREEAFVRNEESGSIFRIHHCSESNERKVSACKTIDTVIGICTYNKSMEKALPLRSNHFQKTPYQQFLNVTVVLSCEISFYPPGKLL